MKIEGKIGRSVTLIMLLVMFSFSVYALTGSIGNARMILKVEVGDTLNKYVLVKNVNDEAININISVSGNLTKDVTLKDESFVLQAGEEKKAYFSIKARKAGNYETRINVKFSSLGEEKQGVGLSSVIILNVYGKGELPEDENNEDVNATEENINNEDNPLSLTGAFLGEGKSILPIILSLVMTLILVFILIMILRKAKLKVSKVKRKRSDRSS